MIEAEARNFIRDNCFSYPERAKEIWVYDRAFLGEQLRFIDENKTFSNHGTKREITNLLERIYYLHWKPHPNNVPINIWLRKTVKAIVAFLDDMPEHHTLLEMVENILIKELKNGLINSGKHRRGT